MQKYILDFSLLPDLKYSVWLYTLGNEIENSLRALPKTLGRAEAAMFFVYQLACSDDSGPRKEAYLRAALAEFVSMEEMLARDLANLGKSEPILKCIDTKDPLIHIAKALRNLEIHLQSSKMSHRSLIWMTQ
ncbi:hypothetical protein H6F74_06760 [Trichocoleus sp. FACHB-90]|uniref:hypothetical protein n=1 Tax=Cyanophyceae TaxID=3028117 RepID=UPI001685D726|nr:hypothetical protein [Trichocoleus sp. FACHB-90]MBD1925984.1 hypothetical protein [Trichocoleus sp. FACHB-90]